MILDNLVNGEIKLSKSEKWIALSTYDRGDTVTDTVSTELTGVLPEYRRKSICTALRV